MEKKDLHTESAAAKRGKENIGQELGKNATQAKLVPANHAPAKLLSERPKSAGIILSTVALSARNPAAQIAAVLRERHIEPERAVSRERLRQVLSLLALLVQKYKY